MDGKVCGDLNTSRLLFTLNYSSLFSIYLPPFVFPNLLLHSLYSHRAASPITPASGCLAAATTTHSLDPMTPNCILLLEPLVTADRGSSPARLARGTPAPPHLLLVRVVVILPNDRFKKTLGYRSDWCV